MTSKPADRLRSARIARGFASAADAARAFGWNVPTYTSHENGTRGIRSDAAERYASAFGITAAELMGLPPGRSSTVEEVPVLGRAEVGLWRDRRLDAATITSPLSVPAVGPGLGGRDLRFAVQVGDDSLNRILAKGEYAICTPISDDQSDVQVNWLVWIERERDGLVAQSIRRVISVAGGRIVMQSHSKSPALMETISIPSERRDERVTIKGRVIGRYGLLDFASD